MKKSLTWVLGLVAVAGLYGCSNDDSNHNASNNEVPQCLENQILVDGVCQNKIEVPVETGNNCDPACEDNEICEDGKCKDDVTSVEPPVIDPPEVPVDVTYEFTLSPSGKEITTVTGETASFDVVLSQSPSKDVVIPVVSQNTKAGTLSTDKIVFNADNWNSPQHVMVTGTSDSLEDPVVSYVVTVGPSESEDEHFNHLEAVEVKVNHYSLTPSVSKPKSLTLDTENASLFLYGNEVTIKATLDEAAEDKVIYWDIENTTDSVEWQHLVNANFDMNQHTITLKSNVVLNTEDTQKYHLDYARTLKVTAKHSSGMSASATVELKPYLPNRGLTLTNLRSIRDFSTPGHKRKSVAAGTYEKGEMGCGYYDEHTAQVLTYDMFKDFVEPAMYKDEDGKLHATRASVLAAARFLVVQFPKDIPYASISLYNSTNLKKHAGNMAVSTIANFTWASSSYNSDINKVKVYGFSLLDKSYNNYTTFTDDHVVLGGNGMDTVVPWGCPVSRDDGADITEDGEKVAYPYNGLCCSGFVSWSLSNGLMGLGNWPTRIFGQNGDCVDKKGNYVRNFRCRQFWGEEQKDSDSYQAKTNESIANPNSKHENAFEKMNMLKDEDFVKVSDLTENSDIKAGDLLWVGHYHCTLDKDKNGKKICRYGESYCTKGNGHVAMILGISKHKDNTINKVYVAEAIGVSGNHLSAYTIEKLKEDNTWKYQEPTTGSNCNNFHDTRVIKMDRVYNYEHTKNPDKVKEDLNTYQYTDLWF